MALDQPVSEAEQVGAVRDGEAARAVGRVGVHADRESHLRLQELTATVIDEERRQVAGAGDPHALLAQIDDHAEDGRQHPLLA